ncbi:molybdenum cofactor biosynthesis enzyme MoaA [Parabacteroides sp. PFB2-12]|uniref:radical SAM protein n=1 Tax=Parabacteroides sp. PFB2-12 TaxID=2940652 RepID=UPI0024765C39|nr:radical SAM protein [Parabacteroides sp. PFB2-12]MDH6392202.1 molybdenum cofactor biosynthesis enzyme MoaA [Parabacteroides sp. PFB2-12]
MNNTPISLFGKPIAVKTHACHHDDCEGEPISPCVNLFVKVTNGCNAHCAFCSNANQPITTGFDIDKLFRVIDEALQKELVINRINITGGEPSCVPNRVEQILSRMDERRYQDIHVHLNTNGLLAQSQELMRHPRWDSISVSLHHYDPKKLSEIYSTRVSSQALCFEGIDMMKVNASCNLIQGYIDSTGEAHRMMDFCLEKGFTRLGFVGLMPINEYSRSRFVSLDELKLNEISHCYFTESKNRGADCKCSNYMYNKNLRVLDIYMRHYANPLYCDSSLMFDGQHLRQGFHDDSIII